jgi:hypothetical protein
VTESTTFSTSLRPFYTTSYETLQTLVLEEWLVESIIAYEPTLIGAPETGIRKISDRFLTSRDDHITHPDIEVPVYMYSVPALEFIGFDNATSRRPLKHWIPCSDYVGHEDMVSDYLDGQLAGTWRGWGGIDVDEKIQETIMDMGFEDVSGREVSSCWIKECVFENHVFLEGLQRQIWCNFRAMRDGAPPGHRGW